MEHSKNFKKVKDYYDDKLWDERRVRLAVGRWITVEEYKEITDYIEGKMRNRIKPNFGDDSHAYFQRLIDGEKRKLSSMLKTPNS